jgi:serine/threonine protein kinase
MQRMLSDTSSYENVVLRTRKGWEPWLGKILGSGQYGSAFGTTSSRALAGTFGRLKNVMKHVVFEKLPPDTRGTSIAIKAQIIQFSAETKLAVIENAVHRAISKAPCVQLMGTTRPLCAQEYVPQFFFSGQVRNRYENPRARPTVQREFMYVTVMGRAPGVSVYTYLDKHGGEITAALYVKIERALCSLWVNGIFHLDAHGDNILYDKASGKVTVIDFGFAVMADAEMTEKVKAAIVQGISRGVRSLGEIWSPQNKSNLGLDLKQYTNRVLRGRGVPGSNPDGYMLALFFNEMSESERRKVPNERKKLWDYVPGYNPFRTTPTTPTVSTPSPTPSTTRLQRWLPFL